MSQPRRRTKRTGRDRRWPKLAFGLVIIAAAAAGILVGLTRAQVARSDKPVSAAATFIIQLNGSIMPSSAGTIVAISDGLFRKDGLNVELRPGVDDASALTAVAADDRVIGIASAQAFIHARANGAPIVAFAAAYISSSVEFFALSRTQLQKPADIEGKRIGYKRGLNHSVVLNAFIARNSIFQSTLTLVESDHAVADLVNGQIDVLVGRWDVEGQEIKSSNMPYRSLSPDSFGVHAMGPVYFASERAFLSPTAIEKILTEINAGWSAAYSDYNRTVPLISNVIKSELSSVQISRFMDEQRRFLRPTGTRFGELDKRRFSDMQDFLLKQRVIDRPIDLARAVNSDILTEIYRPKSDTYSWPGR